MKEPTWDEILDIVCATAIVDEPEESDYVDGDEKDEENFVKKLISDGRR